MLKLQAIYSLPTKPVDLTNYVLRPNWIPELGGVLELDGDSELLQELQVEGRLTVNCLVDDYVDGHRIAQMHTVWFDGKPLLIVQDAGRSGRDFSRRWLTHPVEYQKLLQYLLSKVRVPDAVGDVADPEALVYEDDVLFFYGRYFGDRFGFEREPQAEGYLIFRPWDTKGIVPVAPADHLLVAVHPDIQEPALYIRRQGFVAKYVRPLNDQELASNPKLAEPAFGEVVQTFHWYRESEVPADTPVLSV